MSVKPFCSYEAAMEREAELSRKYHAMLATLGVDAARYPLLWHPTHDGSYHVEPGPAGSWRLCQSERGAADTADNFLEPDALLFRLACSIVGIEGALWQAQHSQPGRDPRRADFKRRLELMGRISLSWQSRLAEELAQWLVRHPYRDQDAQEEPSSTVRKGLLLSAIVALGVTMFAGAHWPLWSVWQQQSRLEKHGVMTRARVLETHRIDGKFADLYRIDYVFEASGSRQNGSDDVSWQALRAAEMEGSWIDILHDSQDLRQSMVDGNDRAGRLLAIYIAIDALLAFLIAAGLFTLRREVAAAD